MEDDWVVDSLVGFLQSPVWKFPADTFMEQECIVFDEGGDNEVVYRHVYKEYKIIVNQLMNTFMSELGVSEGQLTEACAKSKNLGAKQEKLFQLLLASGNYETFKSIMTQKNIDLELQALVLLQKQLGQSPDVYDSNAEASPTPQQKLAKRDTEEDEALKHALKLSKKESELRLMAEDQEMEKLLELAIQESLKMHQASLQQHEEGNKAGQNPVQEGVRGTNSVEEVVQTPRETETARDVSVTRLDAIPPIGSAPMQQEISGEQAAQMWIQSAKSELENRQSPIVKQHVSRGLPEELKARERYLRSQRDRLLESKKKARAEELKRYKESAQSSHSPRDSTPSQQRPAEKVGKVWEDPGEVRKESSSEEQIGKKLTPKSSSGVLCSVIARKLKEEQTS